jgi:hypothetical protein
MAHKTQLGRAKAKLERDGFVTRNECLSQFPGITRLGARICDLQEEGDIHDGEHGARLLVPLVVTPAAKDGSDEIIGVPQRAFRKVRRLFVKLHADINVACSGLIHHTSADRAN